MAFVGKGKETRPKRGALPTRQPLARLAPVFDPAALRFLADVMGEDRVMLGSDYPFPLGEELVGELIRTADGFSDEARSKLLGGNALRFLDIEA